MTTIYYHTLHEIASFFFYFLCNIATRSFFNAPASVMKCPNGVFPAESSSMRMMDIGITAARTTALPAAAVAMDRPIIVSKVDFAMIGRARTKV